MAQRIPVDRFIDIDKEPTKTLLPIEGYEKVSLLPLKDSVASIKIPILNLEKMVWAAERNCKNPADGLTADESASIHLYTMGATEEPNNFYNVLNKRLRSEKRDELKSFFPYLKLFLTALYKLPSLATTVWRGISGDCSHLFKGDCIWWGVSSCSDKLEVIEGFVGKENIRTICMIKCINGKLIQNHSHYPNENEIILMPGTYLRVMGKLSPSVGVHIVHLQEETPPHQLLAPPFHLPSSVLTNDARLNRLTISERSQSNSPVSSAQSYKSKTTTNSLSATPKYRNSKLEQKIKDNEDRSELYLNKLNLTDNDMEIVADYLLQNNQTLTTLYLQENRIGDKGAQYIGNGLQNNTVLTELYLHNNQISDKGVQYLSEALSYNTTLTELSLSENQIGTEGAQYLGEALQKNKTLTRLDLSNNRIGAEGAQHLGQGFQKNKTLTTLDLSKNQIGAQGAQFLSEILQRNKKLETLFLDNNQIGDRGAQYLGEGLQQNNTLTKLDLLNNQIGNSGTQYLEKLKKNNRNLNVSW